MLTATVAQAVFLVSAGYLVLTAAGVDAASPQIVWVALLAPQTTLAMGLVATDLRLCWSLVGQVAGTYSLLQTCRATSQKLEIFTAAAVLVVVLSATGLQAELAHLVFALWSGNHEKIRTNSKQKIALEICKKRRAAIRA
jgi:hypothetical protein